MTNKKSQPKNRRTASSAAAKPSKTGQPATKPGQAEVSAPRRGRFHRRAKPSTPPVRLPNVIRLTTIASRLLWQHKGLFAGVTAIYGVLNLVLAQALVSNANFSNLKQQLQQVFSAHTGSAGSGLTSYVNLFGSSSSSTSSAAGAYQFIVGVIASLAIIWALRQVAAGTVVRIRDAYYKGMYPLVPFVLVLMVVGLQLLPLLIGAGLYSLVIQQGIAIVFVEKLIFGVIFALTALLSFYFISSSVFALYIATLPDMTPLKALRSARQLVKYRRWMVVRKLLFLPLLLVIATIIIMLPVIIWLTPLAQWVFLLVSITTLTVTHGYLYTLYRELLNE